MGDRSTTGRYSRKLGGLAIALAVVAVSPRASAQSPEELKAARELFQDAYKAEQDKRYGEALEKFERVAKVKESASVRYRIATVLAGMGRLREARDAYRALAASRASLPASDQETADSAAEKAAELDKRIPRLLLSVEDEPPPETRISVDGSPLPQGPTQRPVELDPGDHVVAASGVGVRTYQHTVTLADGAGEVTHAIRFEKEAPKARSHPLAWGVVGAGGVVALVGGALLIAREAAIGDIEASCPGNVCPASTRSQVESDRDRAHLFAPLGVTLSVAGLIGVGVGVYLLVRPPSDGAHRATTSATRFLSGASPRGTSGMRFTFAF
ncbi:MAG TPA: tetratricopeptide repeat protein [Labilithrix sp.]|nr:tetratricopeptide repeat protein [Labilithrix sp.]